MAYQRTPYVESKRAEARARLLRAAVELVGRGGWREVQMSSVAAAAGLSTGALYLHFPSKTQLLVEVYRAQAAEELRVVAEIAAQEAPAAERLATSIRAFAQRALSNRRLAYALVVEPTDIEIEQERLHFHLEFIQVFAGMLEAGRASGEFDVAQPHVAAACIFGGITESLMGPLGAAVKDPLKARGELRAEAQVLVDSVVEFCFHGLAKPRKPGHTPNMSGRSTISKSVRSRK